MKIVSGSTIFSFLNIQCSSASATYKISVCNNLSEGVWDSDPSIVYQCCLTPGQIAAGCHSRYTPLCLTSTHINATLNAIIANELVWCPNSVATSHMTPKEGNLL